MISSGEKIPNWTSLTLQRSAAEWVNWWTAAVTVRNDVNASSCCRFFAIVLSCAISGSKYTDEGILMFVATLIISLSHGTPRVTFLLETPA